MLTLWLDKATIARDRFLTGELSEKDAMKITFVLTNQELKEISADFTLDFSSTPS